MARKKQQELIRGHAAHRRTESDYMGVLLETVTLDDWRAVVSNARTLAQAGDVQIELVEQHDDTPSVYRDAFPTGPPGGMAFHHVAVIVADVAEETARYNALGFETGSSGRFGDVDFTYVDTRTAGGFMVEVLPDSDTINRFFGAVRRAAEEWDGRTAWREM